MGRINSQADSTIYKCEKPQIGLGYGRLMDILLPGKHASIKSAAFPPSSY
jgi:hypothetical protein